jgi:hypothetical protein
MPQQQLGVDRGRIVAGFERDVARDGAAGGLLKEQTAGGLGC